MTPRKPRPSPSTSQAASEVPAEDDDPPACGNVTVTSESAARAEYEQASARFHDAFASRRQMWLEYAREGRNRDRHAPQLNTSQLDALDTAVAGLTHMPPGAPASIARQLRELVRRMRVVLRESWKELGSHLTESELKNTTRTLNATIDALLVTTATLSRLDGLTGSDLRQEWERACMTEVVADTVDVLLDVAGPSEQLRETVVPDLRLAVEKLLASASPQLQAAIGKMQDVALREHRSESAAEWKAACAMMEQAAHAASLQMKGLVPLLSNRRHVSYVHRLALADVFFLCACVLRKARDVVTQLGKDMQSGHAGRNMLRTLWQDSAKAVSSGVAGLKAGIAALPRHALDVDLRLAGQFFRLRDMAPMACARLTEHGRRQAREIRGRAELAVTKSGLAAQSARQSIIRRIGAAPPEAAAIHAALATAPLPLLAAAHTLQKYAGELMIAASPLHAQEKQKRRNNNAMRARVSSAIVLPWDEREHRHNVLRSAMQTASSDAKKWALMAEAALTAVVDTALTDATAINAGKVDTAEATLLQMQAVTAAAHKACKVAAQAEQTAAEETLIRDMQSAFSHVVWTQRTDAEHILDRLAAKLKPAACKLLSAAAELRAAAHAADTRRYGDTRRLAEQAGIKAVAAKADIKLAAVTLLGAPLHRHSRRGLLANAIGEWVEAEKAAFRDAYPDADPMMIDHAMSALLSTEIGEDFSVDTDPGGVLLQKQIALAAADAANGGVSWPATADELLASTPTVSAYLRRWGEKKISYTLTLGLLSEVVGHGAGALDYFISLHPGKALLTPRLRYLKAILAPVSMALGVSALKRSVRPGEDFPYEHIRTLLKRQVFMLAFRLLTSVLPAVVNNIMALAIAGAGVARRGPYRDGFVQRARSRLPIDLLYAGGRVLLLSGIGSVTRSRSANLSDRQGKATVLFRTARHVTKPEPAAWQSAGHGETRIGVSRAASPPDRDDRHLGLSLSQDASGSNLTAIDMGGTMAKKAVARLRTRLPASAYYHLPPAQFQASLQERYRISDAELLRFGTQNRGHPLDPVTDFTALLKEAREGETGHIVAPYPYADTGVVGEIEGYIARTDEEIALSYARYHQYRAMLGMRHH